MGFLPGGSGTTVRHNTHKYISHCAQNKHSSQSCTNNKGHITHNDYNTKKVKLSLQQAMEAYGVVRCCGSHIVQTICSQIVIRLSTLNSGHALPPEIFWYSFLLQVE
jgi:hypothetical protein